MPESVGHARLVDSLVGWIAATQLDGDPGAILVDCPASVASAKPPAILGFIPDVFVRKSVGRSLIIGEAKTARDLESRHTREQLTAFLTRCAQVRSSMLVLAVPWYLERFAKVALRRLKIASNATGVETVVLEQLPG